MPSPVNGALGLAWPMLLVKVGKDFEYRPDPAGLEHGVGDRAPWPSPGGERSMRMSRASRMRIALVAGLVVALLAVPGWSSAQDAKYSGTVVAVDQSAGTIVVEGMGPWQVKDGETQFQRRTIAIGPSTEFVRLERASGPAPSGFVGDFVEREATEQQVKPGDWVTVTLSAQDKRPTALRVDVWEPTAS